MVVSMRRITLDIRDVEHQGAQSPHTCAVNDDHRTGLFMDISGEQAELTALLKTALLAATGGMQATVTYGNASASFDKAGKGAFISIQTPLSTVSKTHVITLAMLGAYAQDIMALDKITCYPE
jgi:hypothetical protein